MRPRNTHERLVREPEPERQRGEPRTRPSCCRRGPRSRDGRIASSAPVSLPPAPAPLELPRWRQTRRQRRDRCHERPEPAPRRAAVVSRRAIAKTIALPATQHGASPFAARVALVPSGSATKRLHQGTSSARQAPSIEPHRRDHRRRRALLPARFRAVARREAAGTSAHARPAGDRSRTRQRRTDIPVMPEGA